MTLKDPDALREYQARWRREERTKDPDKVRQKARERYARNREKILAQVKNYQDQNSEMVKERKRVRYHSQSHEEKRRRSLWTLYGLTLEEYEQMYKSQEGKCPICKVWYELLHVDHDQDTGEVRGLLCHKCNKAIGLLGENLNALQKAIEYLEEVKKEAPT